MWDFHLELRFQAWQSCTVYIFTLHRHPRSLVVLLFLWEMSECQNGTRLNWELDPGPEFIMKQLNLI